MLVFNPMKQLELELNEPNIICPDCEGCGWNWNPSCMSDDTKYTCRTCEGKGYLLEEKEVEDWY